MIETADHAPIILSNEHSKGVDSPSSTLEVYDVLSYFSATDLTHRCASQGRYWLHGEELAGQMLPCLKERIGSLTEDRCLIIDFQNVHASNDFLLGLLQPLFFPEVYDGRRLTKRYVEGKRVIIANPDRATLLGMSLFLENAHTHCMVIPDTQTHPWELLYAGHLEKRLEGLLNDILSKGTITTPQLVEEAAKKAQRENSVLPESFVEKEGSRFAGQLKELYDFGLVQRSKIKIEGRSQEPFQYTMYHPYRSIVPDYIPPPPRMYLAPRPPKTQKSSDVASVGNKPEEPEPPDTRLKIDAFIAQNYHHLERFLEQSLLHPEQINLGLEVASSLVPYWLMGGLYTQGQESLERLLQHANPNTNPIAKATILNQLGILFRRQDQYELARHNHQEGLSIFQSFGYSAGCAQAYLGLANIDRQQSKYDEAREMAQQSILHATKTNDQGTFWRARFTLACIQHLNGNNAAAAIEIDRCIETEKIKNDKVGLAVSLLWKGHIQRHLDDFKGARRSYDESISLAEEVDDKPGIAYASIWLGAMNVIEGNLSEATTFLAASLRLFQKQKDKRSIARVLEIMASLASLEHEAERGTFLFAAAVHLREEINSPLIDDDINKDCDYFTIGTIIEGYLSTEIQTRRSKIWEKGVKTPLDEVLQYARREIDITDFDMGIQSGSGEPINTPTTLRVEKMARSPRAAKVVKDKIKEESDEPDSHSGPKSETLSDLIQGRYEQLREHERQALRYLSVFEARWEAKKARAVLEVADVTESLHRLTEAGFIQSASKEGSYEFAEGAQNFAREKLSQNKQEQRQAEARLTHFLARKFVEKDEHNGSR